jgi:2-amino-4-hydroxy-6-hydroxymethyldihydropteridine diphosphokinase
VTTAYLGLGSNQDAEHKLRAAVTALRERFGAVRLSPVYRSRAVGFAGDDFINFAASIETGMGAMELRSWLRELEAQHGRRRDAPKFSDRSLDVDILLFGDTTSDDPELPLPRPEILLFAHVLRPLAELAPQQTYPGRSETLAQLWVNSELREVPLQAIDAGFLGGKN